MPQAKFKSVYAVSSEDPAHPASNLLKIESGKKWKTKNAGEKSAFVILQFDQSQKIRGIDIGNEHAAFVEVLVGKNACSQDSFKEIMLTCSFMTPFESKSSSNPNRVRCFTHLSLVQEVAAEKWDLLKLVCTQPFNKHVQYGLSFVKIHVAEAAESKKEERRVAPPQLQPATQKEENGKNQQGNKKKEEKQIGMFLLRDDSSSDSEDATSLFRRWKQAKSSKNLSTAAEIREASSPVALRTQSENLKPGKTFRMRPESSSLLSDETDRPIRDRNRNDLVFNNDEDEAPSNKTQLRLLADVVRISNEKNELEKKTKGTPPSKPKKVSEESEKAGNSKPKIKPITTIYPSPSTSKRSVSPSSSPANSAKKFKPVKQIEYRPFNELLKGVVLVVSGIQNPERGELRRKALEMGAKYKPDWDNTCTHLICAFKNTPKYNQVKGKGKIIVKDWVEKCYSLKKKLPWRRYALDDREGKKPESEDEIFDISLKPKEKELEHEEEEQSFKTRKAASPQRKKSYDDTLLQYDLEQTNSRSTMQPLLMEDSGSDTEEEIEKVRQLQLKEQESISKQEKDKVIKKENTYDDSTEEEEFTKKNKGSWTPPLKEFFSEKKFFVSDKLKIGEQAKVKAQAEKYGGTVTDLVSKADFVVTNETIGTPSDFSGEMVKPSWVYECTDLEGLVPTNRFKV